MSRTARDAVLVGLCWAASRVIALLCLEAPVTIAFDEAQYLEESFLLASGAPAEFYKGPFVYLLAGGGMLFAPARAAARAVALLMDLLLVAGFWLSVRRDDRMTATAGAMLLACCPLAAWFSLHLLTDVPFAAFSFLCVHAFSRGATPRASLEAAVWLCAAMLVKSTALLLAPALVLCAVLQRRSARGLVVPLAAGAAVYAALPLVWSRTSDATFIGALPWMSFRCGLLYFPLAALIAAGPAITIGAAWRFVGPGRGASATGALCALLILAGAYTVFGDPQPKYVVTLAPFLALPAAQVLSRARPALIVVCIAASMAMVVPVVRLMEADTGMADTARYLGSLPLEAIHTTIPEGVHRHAFAGALRFSNPESGARPLRTASALEGPMAIWTDYTGDPGALEARLSTSGLPWRRLDVYTNRNDRPVYLVGLDAPDPERLRWEPNILTSAFVTPLDAPIRAAKRAAKSFTQPSRKE